MPYFPLKLVASLILAAACGPALAQIDLSRSGRVDTLVSNPKKLMYVSENLARNATATYRYLDDVYAVHTGDAASNLQLVDDPSGSGRKVLLLKTLKTDPLVSGASRTEISAKYEYVIEGLRWYGFAMMFPSDWQFHATPTVVAQLHTSQKTLTVPPPVAVVAYGQDLNLELHYNFRKTDGSGLDPATRANTGEQLARLAKLQTNKWYCFVVRADWSAKPGIGSLKVWMNGNLAYDVKNAYNSYETWLGNYPKVGLYMPGVMGVASRSLYTDFIYVGGASSTYELMAAQLPCGSTVSPTPTVVK
ncbi:MAG: polysaccharide lyase [Burkholderiaceae bacterium]|nr:polysaccharide lyase [Burkholderiaceae bacterium]